MEILKTEQYELFKFKDENREINFNKVASLKSRLINDGRQIIPIIVNSNMEIIDGQHRFKALKELGWSIMYYIDDSVSSKDLISINNSQRNWGLNDFIHYHASLGTKTFVGLEKVCKQYEFPLKVVLSALSKGKYIKEHKIKDGNLELSVEEFEEGIKTLEYLKNIQDNIKQKIISPAIIFFLITKIYYLEDIDRERLANGVIRNYGTDNYGNAEQCAYVLEKWYNKNFRTYRYISNEIMPKR